tara:strand:+ start:1435 stop:1611 length:177 start_codon:yes stop_codon:yes gene_type:complete
MQQEGNLVVNDCLVGGLVKNVRKSVGKNVRQGRKREKREQKEQRKEREKREQKRTRRK